MHLDTIALPPDETTRLDLVIGVIALSLADLVGERAARLAGVRRRALQRWLPLLVVLLATTVTLILVPSLYLAAERLKARLQGSSLPRAAMEKSE